jgi:hypothetical protein
MNRVFLLLSTLTLAACPVDNVGEQDAVGREGRVLFTTETKVAFSSRLVVGSTFAVTIKETLAEDKDIVSRAVLGSSDLAKLNVEPIEGGARVTVVEAGTYELIAQASAEDGNGLIDAIEIKSAVPSVTALVDGDLLVATDSVDARLTQRFAFLTDVDNTFFISAIDKCGGDLFDLHASTIEVAGVPAVVEAAGPAQFKMRTEVPGEVTITLNTPGIDPLEYDAASIDASGVDEVRASTSKLEEGNLTIWGRAFADDRELMGPLTFTWRADERVTLSALTGPAVIAAVSFPAEGQPPDERPAVVTTEIFGEEGSLNLLGPLTQETSRGDPPRKFEGNVSTQAGCAGGEACNPEVAAAGLFVFAMRRRLRRLV